MFISALDAGEVDLAGGVRDDAVCEWARACPEVVVVDEAAACDGEGGRGVEERFEVAAGCEAGCHVEEGVGASGNDLGSNHDV